MKNLLYMIVALLSVANAFGAEPIEGRRIGSDIIAQEFSNFVILEKRHCDDWFNFKLNKETGLINLEKRHHDECADFKANLIKEIGNGKITKYQLDEAIALHKKHKAEHRKFWNDIYKAKVSIMDAHDGELEAFEKNPNVIPEFKISGIPGRIVNVRK